MLAWMGTGTMMALSFVAGAAAAAISILTLRGPADRAGEAPAASAAGRRTAERKAAGTALPDGVPGAKPSPAKAPSPDAPNSAAKVALSEAEQERVSAAVDAAGKDVVAHLRAFYLEATETLRAPTRSSMSGCAR